MADTDVRGGAGDRWVNRVLALTFLVVFARAVPIFLGELGGGGPVYSLVALLIVLGFVGGILVGLYVLVTGDDGERLVARTTA